MVSPCSAAFAASALNSAADTEYGACGTRDTGCGSNAAFNCFALSMIAAACSGLKPMISTKVW
ncbi:hypothetical protein D3C87_1656290 [compost metagenome]